jgi:hypothetical protein
MNFPLSPAPQGDLATLALGPLTNPADSGAGSCDPVEAYFECITTCSLEDGECVTQCVELLRENG